MVCSRAEGAAPGVALLHMLVVLLIGDLWMCGMMLPLTMVPLLTGCQPPHPCEWQAARGGLTSAYFVLVPNK